MVQRYMLLLLLKADKETVLQSFRWKYHDFIVRLFFVDSPFSEAQTEFNLIGKKHGKPEEI